MATQSRSTRKPPDITLNATLKQKHDFLEELLDAAFRKQLTVDPNFAAKELRKAGVSVPRGSTIRAVAPLPTTAQVKNAIAQLKREAKGYPHVDVTGRTGYLYLRVSSNPVDARIGLTHAMPFVAVDDG